MTNTKTILEATGLRYPLYDGWRFDNFIYWCTLTAQKQFISAKVLIKHDGMLNWYCDMWQLHVEKQFLKDNLDLVQLNDPIEVQKILMTYPDEILVMQPYALLKMITNPKPNYKVA